MYLVQDYSWHNSTFYVWKFLKIFYIRSVSQSWQLSKWSSQQLSTLTNWCFHIYSTITEINHDIIWHQQTLTLSISTVQTLLIYSLADTDQAYERVSCIQLEKRCQRPLCVWLQNRIPPGNHAAKEQWRLELPDICITENKSLRVTTDQWWQ